MRPYVTLLMIVATGCGSTSNKSAFDLPSEWTCSATTSDDAGAELRLTGQLREVPTGLAAGFQYSVCAKDDLACARPLGTGEGGNVDVKVPASFNGFLEVERFVDKNLKTLVWLPSSPSIGSLPPSFLGAPYLPNRGHVMVRFVDCAGRDAAGVTLTVQGADDKSTYYYFEGSGFTVAAEDTNSTGLAAVQHVPAGPVTVVARVSGNVIGERAIAVRANTVSTLEFRASR